MAKTVWIRADDEWIPLATEGGGKSVAMRIGNVWHKLKVVTTNPPGKTLWVFVDGTWKQIGRGEAAIPAPILFAGNWTFRIGDSTTSRWQISILTGADVYHLVKEDMLRDQINPVWNHDRTKIAFDTELYNSPYTESLRIMNADGTDEIQLYEGNMDSHKQFSPNGQRLVFDAVD